MKQIIVKSICMFAALIMTSVASAQKPARFSIETDPATFLWNGYAVHLRVNPPSMKHWTIGAGLYALEFPDFMVDMDKSNKDKGWNMELQQGLGLFSEYYFHGGKRGWFTGMQIGNQKYRISNNQQTGHRDLRNLLLMFHGGYRWYPTNGRIYIQPWFGIGHQARQSGGTRLGALQYHSDDTISFATVHIGYTF